MMHGIHARPFGGKLSWRMALVLQMLCTGTLWAGPEDDFRRAQLAYQRGDFAAAMSGLRPSAEAGHAPSQTLLAYILDHADFPEQAVSLYSKAAAQGDAEAHAGLANLYMTGRGIAKDEKKALVHFSKAAELGHAQSALVMADAHLSGLLGLGKEPQDTAGKVAALLRAAEQGYLPAVQALANAYRDGTLGLAADSAQAAQWQSRVAELRKQRTGAVSKSAP